MHIFSLFRWDPLNTSRQQWDRRLAIWLAYRWNGMVSLLDSMPNASQCEADCLHLLLAQLLTYRAYTRLPVFSCWSCVYKGWTTVFSHSPTILWLESLRKRKIIHHLYICICKEHRIQIWRSILKMFAFFQYWSRKCICGVPNKFPIMGPATTGVIP